VAGRRAEEVEQSSAADVLSALLQTTTHADVQKYNCVGNGATADIDLLNLQFSAVPWWVSLSVCGRVKSSHAAARRVTPFFELPIPDHCVQVKYDIDYKTRNTQSIALPRDEED